METTQFIKKRRPRPKIDLTCHQCHETFSKDRRERDRQIRNGREYFFCSRACNVSHSNIVSPHNSDHLRPYNDRRKKEAEKLSPFRYYIRKARNRNANSNNITVEYLQELWIAQEGKCVYSGISLRLNTTRPGRQDLRYLASLDRIDSSLPYEPGNVQFISASLNLAKSTMTDEMMREFIEIIKSTSK